MDHSINWQEVAAFLVILSALVGFYTNTHVRLNGHDIKIKTLENNQDKTDEKFDKIMEKLENIMIGLSNKQDKDY